VAGKITPVVDRGSPEPPYVQVAGKIREQIRQEMSSGDRLPSVREIAREYGVNARTVQKSLKILTSEGLIASTPGWGTFVV
jgi:DNA-binding GntR family transcriptional regulator